MIETQFNNNQTLKELFLKYNELISNRSVFIENKKYVEILNIIGEIIEELKKTKEIDINKLEPVINFYNEIIKEYNTLFPKDMNSQLDVLNNSMKYQLTTELIFSDMNDTLNNRKSNDVIKLSNDIDKLISWVNGIMAIIEKHNKLSVKEVEKEYNNENTEICTIKKEVKKQNIFFVIFNKIKEILGIKKDKIVADSPYIEINRSKEFREQYMLQESEIKLQHIPNEEIEDYIDGKKGAFNKIDGVFYGLSNPREVILANNDNYYYYENDDDAYIIADKTNTDKPSYKNTDTIICSDEGQYFRIASDDTTIVYEEYKAKTYTDKYNLFIRQPLNSKVGRKYIKHKIQEHGLTTEYYYEEERNGMCSVNIHKKSEIKNIYMLYKSKDDIITGKKPKRIMINNVLIKTEFEQEYRNRYKGKYYMYILGEGEWGEPMKLDRRYKYNQIMEKYGYIVKDLDSSIVDTDTIRDGIKNVIPEMIMEIYSRIHPEIALEIKNHGEINENEHSYEKD